jgi:hypothetical protein
MRDKVDRTTAVMWSNRGKDERDHGFPERALACFDKALEFDPIPTLSSTKPRLFWICGAYRRHPYVRPEHYLWTHDRKGPISTVV